MTRIALVLLWLGVLTGGFAADGGPCVVPGRGYFRIKTDTSGLFGAFAHEHEIEAQKIEGCAVIDSANPTRSSIKLTFTTADIRVMDPKEAKDRPKVQETMEREVLQVSQFPRITFESTSIETSGANAYRVHGNLTIRGRTQPVIIPVTMTRVEGGIYRATGTYKFKQTTFGIRPVQLAGGTVKVKDEIATQFELFLK